MARRLFPPLPTLSDLAGSDGHPSHKRGQRGQNRPARLSQEAAAVKGDFAHPCMGLFVKSVCLSVRDFLISSLKGPVSLFDPQNRFFVPTMRQRQ